MKRRKTRTVMKGDVPVGSEHPISIQTMTKVDTADVEASVQEIWRLAAAGAEIVRVSVPGAKAAKAIAEIKPQVNVPIVADIHFSPALALKAIEAGADCIRINPGNIGQHVEAIKEICRRCKDRGISMRVGGNEGSIMERKGIEVVEHDTDPVEKMVTEVLRNCEILENEDFGDIVVSVKSHDPLETIRAYRLIAARCDYPLHLGVTHAGTLEQATIKTAVAFGALLTEGIGDTIRVSITGDPADEVRVGREILQSLGLKKRGLEVYACPSCGRADVDVLELTEEVEETVRGLDVDVRIAVMGCEVNGPGEAAQADIGIAAGRGWGFIMSRGKILEKVESARLAERLKHHILKMKDEGALAARSGE
ncbi:MAG: flavodoxin-dependent (E)-4-hydroxy-3-methylbut-2-enyl-diphosphate synthase [Planctomycetota bacterium]|jgi:(E)-4-hydroxy-3-methylbut-2-enyl-diphosphate synthase